MWSLISNINMRNLLKIASIANLFEWYEFVIYAYLAEVIGQLFFHSADSVSGVIKAFTVFAVGYFARPLGSLFFGVMGDRLGRGRPLNMTLLLMAVPTVLIGLLPTYQKVGLFAPAWLLTLRLIQGFAMGGELPVNACYIYEVSPVEHRSVLCSTVSASMILGMLSASLVAYLLFRVFDYPTILQWAWRIPFLLSLPLTISIVMIRRMIRVLPVPEIRRSACPQNLARYFLGWPLLKAILLSSFGAASFYVSFIWMPYYLIHFLNYSHRLAQLTNTLALIALTLFILASGYAARFVGYQKLYRFGVIAMILLICPLWLGLRQASLSAVLGVQLAIALILGIINGICLAQLASLFAPSVRCLGMNLGYTVPAAFVGGATPLICTWMIEKTGWQMFPAFYTMFFGLLALPVVLAKHS